MSRFLLLSRNVAASVVVFAYRATMIITLCLLTAHDHVWFAALCRDGR
jgi:hypothetical protein